MRYLHTLLRIVSITLIPIACGPSAQEIQAKVDQQIEAQKELTEELKKAKNDYFELDRYLTSLKADLAVAEDRLRRVSNFQFGRSRAEREEQLRDATIAVEETKKNIASVEARLPELRNTVQVLQAQVGSR